MSKVYNIRAPTDFSEISEITICSALKNNGIPVYRYERCTALNPNYAVTACLTTFRQDLLRISSSVYQIYWIAHQIYLIYCCNILNI